LGYSSNQWENRDDDDDHQQQEKQHRRPFFVLTTTNQRTPQVYPTTSTCDTKPIAISDRSLTPSIFVCFSTPPTTYYDRLIHLCINLVIF